MLPFLKKRQDVASPGLSIQYRAEDGSTQEDTENNLHTVETCTKELIEAIHAKDTSAAAQAITDIFRILDSEPHEEDEHINPHSYDASKT